MPRKFRVLQIGGDDLEPISSTQKRCELGSLRYRIVSEFDSGYVEAIEAIVEAEGRFDLSISSTVLGDINEFYYK